MRIILGLALLALTGHATLARHEIVARIVDEQGRRWPMPSWSPCRATVLRLPTRRDAVVDQVDKEFTPKVNAILVGTSVIFPNHDNVRHQVYSFSPAKRFELPLYAGVPAQPVVFDTPGVVVLGCNIHDWMVGYVYVSESPYFAKTAPMVRR